MASIIRSIAMASTSLHVVIIMSTLMSMAVADVYFHNPRGSNNRLDANGRERRNANRMFDSQNNARGGYNVGSLYYYAGSKLKIEWTNQHSCNGPNNNCEMIVQYMCHDDLRDGIKETTIPYKARDCQEYNCDKDYRYGMHETYEYYQLCKLRERNKGLFTADQDLDGDTAKYTRQNPDGNRYGYECPEEKDYYPYWGPTEWKDIVIMTNDIDRCDYYKENSQNTNTKSYCRPPNSFMKCSDRFDYTIPITKEACEAFRWPYGDPNGDKAEWVTVASFADSDGGVTTQPECILSKWSRDNHNGNGKEDQVNPNPNTYDWTIPNTISEHCALRIRYNISTNDYRAWDEAEEGEELPPRVDLATLVGLENNEEAQERGYVFQNNPEVALFDGAPNFRLRLAINTAQFGRTFQDRSHSFAIRQRPAELGNHEIHNVNVRGKRGNIVQVYPAVEYDFVPNIVEMEKNDYVHFQWTGSNTNPHNNDGEGLAGTDRSNAVLLRNPNFADMNAFRPAVAFGHLGNSYPMHLDHGVILGFQRDIGINLALLRPGHFGGEISQLDDAGTYFDLGLQQARTLGEFYYMCTRNNNFSNRSQKGTLTVKNPSASQTSEDEGLQNDWVEEQPQADPGESRQEEIPAPKEASSTEEFQQWPRNRVEEYMKSQGRTMQDFGHQYASDYYVKLPAEGFSDGKTSTLKMKLNKGVHEGVTIYHSFDTKTWHRINGYLVYDGIATLQADKGGFYVARIEKDEKSISTILVSGVAIGLALIALLSAFVLHLRQRSRSNAHWKTLEHEAS